MAKPGSSVSEPHRPARKGVKRVHIIAAVVVVVLLALYLFYSTKGIAVISAPETVTITGSPSYFSVGGSVYGISLASKYQSTAYVYVGKLPAFVNPLFNVTLYNGNITRLGIGTRFANLGLTLESLGNRSITVRITPLDINLQLAPDSGKASVTNDLFAPHAAGNTASGGNTAGSTTIVTSTTVASTTTVIQVNSTLTKITAALKKNNYYALMLNYTVLYANTQNCTSSTYSSAFVKAKGYAPSGSFTYQNVSVFVPYMMYSNLTALGSGNYSMSFSTKTVDTVYNNSKALTIKVNASASMVTGVTMQGIFKGGNYSTLFTGYNKALGVGGACGIMVT